MPPADRDRRPVRHSFLVYILCTRDIHIETRAWCAQVVRATKHMRRETPYADCVFPFDYMLSPVLHYTHARHGTPGICIPRRVYNIISRALHACATLFMRHGSRRRRRVFVFVVRNAWTIINEYRREHVRELDALTYAKRDQWNFRQTQTHARNERNTHAHAWQSNTGE